MISASASSSGQQQGNSARVQPELIEWTMGSGETELVRLARLNQDQVWPQVTCDSDLSDTDPWETWIWKTRIHEKSCPRYPPQVTHTGYPGRLRLVDSLG